MIKVEFSDYFYSCKAAPFRTIEEAIEYLLSNRWVKAPLWHRFILNGQLDDNHYVRASGVRGVAYFVELPDQVPEKSNA